MIANGENTASGPHAPNLVAVEPKLEFVQFCKNLSMEVKNAKKWKKYELATHKNAQLKLHCHHMTRV